MSAHRNAEVEQDGVAPGCGGPGVWHCLTHDEKFQNNMTANSHGEDVPGVCVMAFHCFEHGDEQP